MTAATAPTYGNLVNGAFVATAATFEDANPADPADVVARFPASSAGRRRRRGAGGPGRAAGLAGDPPVVRGRHLQALARELRAEEATIVPAITREQGKPLAESRGEFLKTLEYLEYYAALGYEYGGRLLPSARPGVELSVRREPLGVVALLTPWNVPIAIPARKLAPALLCGNTVVVKPSTETPLSCHVIAEAAHARRHPRGRDQRRARPRRDDRHWRWPAPRHQRHLVHGLHRGRPGDGAGRGRAADQGAARARRQERQHRPRRRRPRPRRRPDRDRRALRLRPAVHRDEPHPGAAQRAGGLHRAHADPRQGLAGRARRPRRRAPRAAGLRAAAADGLRVRRRRPLRGRDAAARRWAPGRRAGQRLVRGGHGLRRRHAGDAHRPRGDLRARDRDPAGRHGRGGDRDRQRLAVRPVGGGLHPQPGAREPLRERARRRRDGRNLPSAGWEVQQAFGGFKASGGSGWKEQGTEVLDFFCELKAVQILPG